MHVSIFDVKTLEATAYGTLGAPLTLELRSGNGTRYELTLYIENHVRCERLATAINAAFNPVGWNVIEAGNETNVTPLPMTLRELGQ